MVGTWPSSAKALPTDSEPYISSFIVTLCTKVGASRREETMDDPDSPTATITGLGTQNVCRAFHDPDGDETLVQTVMGPLEEASERPVDEADVCLYDAIDPDALNALFEPTRNGPSRDGGRVSFTVGEFAVDVHGSGNVFVHRMN
jgi:hypothetical protein